jgi:hypothetical protein
MTEPEPFHQPGDKKRVFPVVALVGMAALVVVLAFLLTSRNSARRSAELPWQCKRRYERARTAAESAAVDRFVYSGRNPVASNCGFARRLRDGRLPVQREPALIP